MNSAHDTQLVGKRLIGGVFGWIFTLSLIYACQTQVYVTQTASELANFNKILVIPFQDMSTITGGIMDTRCPVCGRVFIIGEVADNATDFLTDQTTALLKRHTEYQLVFERLTDRSLDDSFSVNTSTNGVRQALVEKGRQNKTDVVLLGLIYRFRERVGTGYSVESPASVAFGMHLIRVTDGRTIWSASFDETQKSLGDNLFQLGSFLSRGGRWVTAEELATSGLEEIFKKFPTI